MYKDNFLRVENMVTKNVRVIPSFLCRYFIFSVCLLCIALFINNTAYSQEPLNYDVKILPHKQSDIKLLPNQKIKISLKILNVSNNILNHSKNNPINLSYHIKKDGEIIQYDGLRTALPSSFYNQIVQANIKAPSKPGNYTYEFDLVHEGVTWFAQKGSKTLELPIEVTQAQESITLQEAKNTNGTSWWCSMPEINQVLPLIRRTFASNEVSFMGESGPVYGFSAGATYPQVWVRDMATINGFAKYFYPAKYLRTWIEEHLSFQREDGCIYDWVDSRGMFDKNTVETDQESSLILAAHTYFKTTRDKKWLRQHIQQLDNALRFVLNNRRCDENGLILSGYTADWGDVSPVYPDHRSVYLDEKTPRVTGLYTNTMFYRAATCLAKMHKALKQDKSAEFWNSQADNIKGTVNNTFWNGSFYEMHHNIFNPQEKNDHTDNLNISKNIFPFGGNAVAILSEIPTKKKIRSIYNVLKSRQQEHDIPEFGAVLLPPFPEDFFTHPNMKPFSYQNGGVWDWFSGRFILGLYKYDLVQEATNELQSVCKRVLENNGFYEWHTKQGKGKGSSNFAGAAAIVGQAITRGLYGITAKNGQYTITVRLKNNDGWIRLDPPSQQESISYHYRSAPQTIRLDITSTGNPQIKNLKILKHGDKWKKVFLNGKCREYTKECHNKYCYYVFNSN